MPRLITQAIEAEKLSTEWRDLVTSDPHSTYFMTPDWNLAWARHLSTGGIRIACWRDADNQLEAVVALSESTETLHHRLPLGIRTSTNMGSGPGAADHCGWTVPEHLSVAVAGWLAAHASNRPLLLRNVDPASVHLIPEGATQIALSRCPRLSISADGHQVDYSSRFRKQLRYYHRRLADRGVSFSWVPPEEVKASHADLAIELHTRRRALKGDESTFTPQRRDFHRALIETAGPGRGPALVIAEKKGEQIGALYGFVWQETFSFYQSGWEPEWGSESLGTVLIDEAIRLLGEAGFQVFDFLRGPEGYKYRFGATDRIDETWLLPRGIAGVALLTKYKLKSATSERGGLSRAGKKP